MSVELFCWNLAGRYPKEKRILCRSEERVGRDFFSDAATACRELYLCLHYRVGQAFSLEEMLAKHGWLIGVDLISYFLGARNELLVLLWWFYAVVLLKAQQWFNSGPLVCHFLCDSCKCASYIRKNTKDFILKSSLSEIHLFQDHSVDNASMGESELENAREKPRNWTNMFSNSGSLGMKGQMFRNISSCREVSGLKTTKGWWADPRQLPSHIHTEICSQADVQICIPFPCSLPRRWPQLIRVKE